MPSEEIMYSDIENVAPQHQNMQNYNTSVSDKKKHIKQPLNSYILWCRARRMKILKENPKMQMREIHKRLGSEWKLLSDKEKIPFIEEAKRLKEQYKSNFPDRKQYRSSKKKKQEKKLSDQVMSVPLTLNSLSSDHVTRYRTQNPQINFYETKFVENIMPPYNMHIPLYIPNTYLPNTYCNDYQQLNMPPYTTTTYSSDLYCNDYQQFNIPPYTTTTYSSNPYCNDNEQFNTPLYATTTYSSNSYCNDYQEFMLKTAHNVKDFSDSQPCTFTCAYQDDCSQDIYRSYSVHSDTSTSPEIPLSRPEPQENGRSLAYLQDISRVSQNQISPSHRLSMFPKFETELVSNPVTIAPFYDGPTMKNESYDFKIQHDFQISEMLCSRKMSEEDHSFYPEEQSFTITHSPPKHYMNL